jgi:hypothetical protein
LEIKASTSSAEVQRPPRRRFRWLKRIAIALCVLLVVAYFTYTPIISAIIGRTLKEAVSSRMHAQLQYDSLTYLFPFQVRIKNVEFESDRSLGNQDLLTIETLDLRLAKFPVPRTPVVIQNLELHSPAFHVIRGESGIVGESGLDRSDEEMREHPPQRKLSELFELRRFVITDGSIRYENHLVPGAEPLVFNGIATDIGVTPQSGAAYAFEMHSAQPPFAQVDATGTMDIDSLVMDLKKLAMTVESKRIDGESALPPKVQRVINDLGIAGRISLNGSAEFPMRDPSQSWIEGDVSLTDAKAAFKTWPGKLENVAAASHIEFRNKQTHLILSQLNASTGPAQMNVRDGMIHFASNEMNFWNIQGDFLDGSLNVRGSVNFNKPVKYKVDFSVADFDVEKLTTSPLIPSFNAKITGQGNINARLVGMVPIDGSRTSEYFGADGTMRISNGKFWNSAWLSSIADRSGIGRDALTSGDAAAVVGIQNRTVTLRRAAIDTAALGLQGKGTITFEGDANLDIMAAPLGDWQKHIQNANIPILSDIGGELAGKLQHMVTTTSRLLYEFQVKGKLPSPQIRAVPAPALTKTTAGVFERMLQQAKSSDLLKSLQEEGN